MGTRRWVIFGICVSLFLMSMFYRTSSAIIASDLSRDLNLDPIDLGLLGAVFFYSFALAQPAVGLFLDRVGPRITIFVLNCIGIGGIIIFASATNLTGGLIGRGLLGVGMAANLMGTFKLLTSWFDLSRFATLSGLAMSLGALGSLAATTPLALLVQSLGWRGSFYSLMALHSLLTALLIFIVRDTPSDGPRSEDVATARAIPLSAPFAAKRLLSNWNYWAISFSVFLRYGAYMSIQGLWAGPFLIQFLGLPSVTAGNLLLMLSFGFVFGSPVSGLLSDRILKSRKKTLIPGFFIASLATFGLAQWQSPSLLPLLGGIFFVIGFFNGFAQVSYAHIRELMPEKMSGTAMSGINFFTFMGGAVFIHGLGGVMERMTPDLSKGGEAYQTAFMLCSGALMAALLLYFTTKDTPAKNSEGVQYHPPHG